MSELIKILHQAIDIINNNEEQEIRKYFLLGELFKNHQSNSKKSLLPELADRLNEKYGKGYSYSSLSAMQRYYEQFRNYPNLTKLTQKLAWNQIIELLKLSDIKEIEYYIKKAIDKNWSKSDIKLALKNDDFKQYIDKVESDDYKFYIKNLLIDNYKSILNVEIKEPSRFSVFIGANASGKSNIFEALEFMFHAMHIAGENSIGIFGGEKQILHFNKPNDPLDIILKIDNDVSFGVQYKEKKIQRYKTVSNKFNEQFINSFSRIFFDKAQKGSGKLKPINKLWFDGSNLSQILKEILSYPKKKEALELGLQAYIPNFKQIAVEKNNIDGELNLKIYENGLKKPISGKLISEGTYSIIGLLTLLYQTDDQQFLCIEEPENGLNPKIINDFVETFRNICAEKGHYIWLTTHSQTLVSALKPDEIILVDKIEDKTIIKQVKDDKTILKKYEENKITMDEAWLNNLLNGGLPW